MNENEIRCSTTGSYQMITEALYLLSLAAALLFGVFHV